MPLPPFVKSPTFLTGFGTVGSGAIGIGGWQFVEGTYPTGHKSLSRKGFKWNPAIPELQANVANGRHNTSSNENKYHLKSYGCFQNFFPGVTVNHSNAPEGDSMEDHLSGSSSSIVDSSGDSIGCALMNLSYEWVDDTVNFILKSEVTVKNDKFGWALWAGGKNMKNSEEERKNEHDTEQKGLSYYLIFLKKKDSDIWSIEGGYYWHDSIFVLSEYRIDYLRIIPPGQEDWAKEVRENKKKGNKGIKQWSGFWEVSTGEEQGSEIFQDIVIWSELNGACKKDDAEILGREFDETKIDFSKDPKIDEVYRGYKQDKGWTEWTKTSDGKSVKKKVGTTLNDLYVPWEGKKGTWKEMKDYCNNTYLRRNLKDKDLKMLQNLCYSK